MKIRSNLLLISGATFLFLPSLAFTQPTPAAAPRIEIDTVYNAGTVWEGDKVSHDFIFRNTGGRTLQITSVRTSCGCTAALVSQKEIEPGQKGAIKAEFNTRRYRGNQRKRVYVSTNDPLHPSLQLELQVEVKSVASFSPRSLNFGSVTRGKEVSQTIRLIPEDSSFQVTGVDIRPEIFQARLAQREGEGSPDQPPFAIEVTLSPEAPVGRHTGNLTVHIDHPQVSQLQTQVVALVEGPVSYSPRTLFFNRRDQENQQIKKVRITPKGKLDLKINSVQTTLPNFQVEVGGDASGGEYEIIVQPKAGVVPGKAYGQVVVRTNQEGQEEIKIPLRTYDR